MKKIPTPLFLGILLSLSLGIAHSQSLDEWLKKPGGRPPVITHWHASEKLRHGDTWRIYVAAKDPDWDMHRIVGILDQVGYGEYPASYVPIRGRSRGELKGYLVFYSTSGMGLWMAEWTQLRLTLFIRDGRGNSSNKLVFPLVLTHGARQKPPGPPFDTGGLAQLGVLWFDLIEPGLDRHEDRYRPHPMR
jgi:hypothetical protein